MLYHLFQYLDKIYDFPGSGLMQYISVRGILASITAICIATIWGHHIIRRLQKKQIGEEIRDLGLEGQISKKGTPTMGGIIIILSIIVPILLFGDLTNIYVILLIISTLILGILGFADDYIKVFRKNKEGLKGKYKIFGQVFVGLIVGVSLYLSDDVVVKDRISIQDPEEGTVITTLSQPYKSTRTTIPFVKDHEFDYEDLVPGEGRLHNALTWGLYIFIIIFIITAVSNGTNLTDGIDGLAAGTSAIVGITLGILAYLSGNVNYSEYLNIMYIPMTGEITVFMAAFIGGLLGFLWYNAYPAQVFMGDTGSLAIGGIIAVCAVMIRKELLIPLLCGIFLVESLSVIFQRFYFKYTKKKYGEGRRIFKMTPIHHHFQKEGIAAIIQSPKRAVPEAKLVMRFWLIGILLAVITIITLKIR